MALLAIGRLTPSSESPTMKKRPSQPDIGQLGPRIRMRGLFAIHHHLDTAIGRKAGDQGLV